MENKVNLGINDLFNIFSPYLSSEDCLFIKLQVDVSDILVSFRLSNNFSLKEFADFLCIEEDVYYEWENGDYNFTLKEIAYIADKLNLDVKLSFNK